jgi:hypothetical protein
MNMSPKVVNNAESKKGAFKSERELQEALTKIDLPLKGSHKITYWRREVPVGACIPDMIYVRFADVPDPLLWPRRWTFRHTYAIWLLRRENELTLVEMANLFYESPNGQIQKTMRDLVRSGAVDENQPQLFTLSTAMKAVEAEVIAVEAKMSKWTRAIEQAQDYLRFADKVFVAMDAILMPRRTKVLDSFHELGIGLCAVFPEKIEWLVYPQFNQNGRGSDYEYLITSAASLSRQTLWSAR